MSKQLRTYMVLYRLPDDPLPCDPPFGFRCQADGSDHAEEQCLDAEPDCEIVWVVETSDYMVALQDYWGITRVSN